MEWYKLLNLALIWLAGIVAIIRFSEVRKEFRPFLYYIWIACIHDSFQFFSSTIHHYLLFNIYCLAESLLFLWFFRNMGIFSKGWMFLWLSLAFVLMWIITNFFLLDLFTRYNDYFTSLTSVILVLFAIHAINRVLLNERDILRNPLFLISLGMLVFFTFASIHDILWLQSEQISIQLLRLLGKTLIWFNIVANLIYAFAILWMRKRQAFTLGF